PPDVAAAHHEVHAPAQVVEPLPRGGGALEVLLLEELVANPEDGVGEPGRRVVEGAVEWRDRGRQLMKRLCHWMLPIGRRRAGVAGGAGGIADVRGRRRDVAE